MQATIKRIDAVTADGLASGPICPMCLQPCLDRRCALWDDERDCCALAAANIYNKVREAVTDAAVDIARTYRKEDLR